MSATLTLRGHHALVCGASRGIGRATAEALASDGADVTLLARNADALAVARDALPTAVPGQQHAVIVADVSDIEALVAKITATANQRAISIVIHNSGGPPGGPAHQATTEAFRLTFEQHLIAGQAILNAVLPGMRRLGYGRWINVISTSVKEPIEGLGVSNTIRAAVASWAKTLAGELAPHGITVNNVLPGYTRTDRLASLIEAKATAGALSVERVEESLRASIPMRRFGEAHEIAAAIAFLASPAAGYITGVNLPVDGGRTRSL